MQKVLFVLLILLVAAAGCKQRPDLQGPGTPALQGVWHQDTLENSEMLRNYTLYDLKFSCDSFYVTLNVHARDNYYADSCFSKDGWKEYAKGTYLVNKDTLMLNGTYTKPNFKQKISGCFNIGQYIENFLISKTGKETLQLENLGNNQAILLNLKEKIICEPKPL